jgi:alkylated DNA repair dioxygenase AlkB
MLAKSLTGNGKDCASRAVNCRRCSGKYRIPLMALSRTSEKRSKIYGDGGTADLFGKPELPDGFHYLPDVLSPAEENAFVRQFEKLPLKPFEFHGYLGNRRIYSFGHRYIFAGQEPRADPSIPDYLRPLTEIANQISGMPAEAFEQLMVTEYAPGAGIGWHRDRPAFDAIVGVSFLAPCTLRLRRKAGADWERRFAHIDPRSAYLLVGPVRNSWQHSIAPMDVLRYSVTLRSFRPGRGSKDQAAIRYGMRGRP